MGRTVPSYRIALEDEIKTWENFRKALRAVDREAFDDMVKVCRLYASASGAAVRPVLTDTMFMVLLLHHHKQLNQKNMQTKDEASEDDRLC